MDEPLKRICLARAVIIGASVDHLVRVWLSLGHVLGRFNTQDILLYRILVRVWRLSVE